MRNVLRILSCVFVLLALFAVVVSPVAACPANVQGFSSCQQNFAYAPQAVFVQPQAVVAYNVVPQLVQANVYQAQNFGYSQNIGFQRNRAAVVVNGGGRGRVVERNVIRGRGVRRGNSAAVIVNGY